MTGQIGVGFVNGLFIHPQFDQTGFKTQGQGGLVADGFLKRVTAQVAFFILFSAKRKEGVAIALIDGGTGHAKQKRIGQRFAHFPAQVAFLGAVSFIHQGNDVVAVVQNAVRFAKLVDGGDDDLAHVLSQQGSQFFTAVG